MFRSILIIGLGLIGGSIAKTVKEKSQGTFIKAVDFNELSLKNAISNGDINEGSLTLPEKIEEELVIIAVSHSETIKIIKELKGRINKNTVVSDVASTKRNIMETARKCDLHNFVGGHPMAGRELSGYDASTSTLLENCYYCLVSENETALMKMKEFVGDLGAMAKVLTENEHDEKVAKISHLPHLLAAALCNFVAKHDDLDDTLKKLCAGGFKDMTRIADSDGNFWNSVIESNKENILNEIDTFISELLFLKEEVVNKGIKDYFLRAKKMRNQIESGNLSLLPKNYVLSMDVKDKPQVLKKITAVIGDAMINIKNLSISNSREGEGGVLLIGFYSEEDKEKAKALLEDLKINA